jgi:hypothetical protein
MNKEIIEQLNNLQLGDLVWWSDKDGTVIGIVTELYYGNAGSIWKAEFPQDGEHCFWGEEYHDYVTKGTLGVL